MKLPYVISSVLLAAPQRHGGRPDPTDRLHRTPDQPARRAARQCSHHEGDARAAPMARAGGSWPTNWRRRRTPGRSLPAGRRTARPRSSASAGESPENAKWEEEHKQFRMEEGKWKLDSCLLDLASGKITNVTAVERVSHYNGGLFFLPDGRGFGFTAADQGHLQTVRDGPRTGGTSGMCRERTAEFAYGYSASPDGKRIGLSRELPALRVRRRRLEQETDPDRHPFNFAPTWSPDGEVAAVRERRALQLPPAHRPARWHRAEEAGRPQWLSGRDRVPRCVRFPRRQQRPARLVR